MSGAFQGKTVVVTGGGSGIGKALAKAFANEGAHVAAADLKGSKEVLASLPGNGHLAIDCDVTNRTQVQQMIQEIKRVHGVIDIFCSNAGIIYSDNLETDNVAKYSEEQWSKIMKVNVISHVTAARELIPDWEAGKGDGIFLVTASAGGLLTMIGDASYGVSKAGAVSFAEHLAIAHPDVQVHCLCPQAVDTPFVDGLFSNDNAAMTDGIISPEYVAECTLRDIAKKSFWIFPHEKVAEYSHFKALDHKKWLKGMQRMRQHVMKPKSSL